MDRKTEEAEGPTGELEKPGFPNWESGVKWRKRLHQGGVAYKPWGNFSRKCNKETKSDGHKGNTVLCQNWEGYFYPENVLHIGETGAVIHG